MKNLKLTFALGFVLSAISPLSQAQSAQALQAPQDPYTECHALSDLGFDTTNLINREDGGFDCQIGKKAKLNDFFYQVHYYSGKTPDSVLTATFDGTPKGVELKSQFVKMAQKVMDANGVAYAYQQPILISAAAIGDKTVKTKFNRVSIAHGKSDKYPSAETVTLKVEGISIEELNTQKP